MPDWTRRATLGAAAGAGLNAAAAQDAEDFAPLSRIQDTLAFLDSVNDLQSGGDGQNALAARLSSALSSAGFQVATQTVQTPYFTATKTELSWSGGAVDVIPQAIVRTTPNGGARGPLRLWRDASDTARMRGAIALVVLPSARHSQLMSAAIRPRLDAVLAAQPAAIVLLTDGPTGETIALNAPFDAPHGNVPIATLGPKPGAAAIAAAISGDEATLRIEGVGGRRESANIFGRLDRGEDVVVVSTPMSGWTRCVAERGPGIAAFEALARWAPAALPGKSLLFLATTAHEYDNAGGGAFLDSALAPPRQRTALWAHLGAGFASRDAHDFGGHLLAPLPSVDPQRFLFAAERFIPALSAIFAGAPGLERIYPLQPNLGGELGEVVRHGYANVFGLLSPHRYHHIAADRLDKTDARFVQDAALRVLAAITACLA
ncbi:MAG: hypothetical protein GC189_03395 [Alphaproteobacteria bacterium]|nr:hypothetical protein [Alphaproteobacteria bacterium]